MQHALIVTSGVRSALLRKQATLQSRFQSGNEIDTADRTPDRFRPAQRLLQIIVAVFGKEPGKIPDARQHRLDRGYGIVAAGQMCVHA